MVKALCFHCRGCRFDPWLGKFLMPGDAAKKKERNKEKGKKKFIKRILLVKQYKIINFINSCHRHTDHFTILCEELENINTILLYTQIQ